MSFTNPGPQATAEILKNSSTIAVVGLSDNPARTSFQVSEAMQKAGYKIIPVNPKVTEVLGEKAVSSLQDIEEEIDIINVFRRSEFLPEVAREAKVIDAEAFWAQQGVFHPEAYEELKDSKQEVIMDSCIKVAHATLL